MIPSIYCIFISWIFCILNLLTPFSVPLTATEKLFFPMDQREWKIGYQATQGNELIIEFVLPNETVENWVELFTIQRFDGLPFTAKGFINALEKSVKTNPFSHEKIDFKVLEPASSKLIKLSFLSKQKEKSDLTEYNLGRVLESPNSLYYIRYSSKDKNIFDQNEQAWITRLKQAYITNNDSSPQIPGQWFTISGEKVIELNKPIEN